MKIRSPLFAALSLFGAVSGSALADDDAQFDKGFDAYEQQDYAGALQAWLPLAKAGERRSQYYVGVVYIEQTEEEDDDAEVENALLQAEQWLEKSAAQEYKPALLELAQLYMHNDMFGGTILDHDWKARVAEHKRKVEQLLLRAVDPATDPDGNFDEEMIEAQKVLGDHYYNIGEHAKAEQWWLKSSQAGNVYATLSLQEFYLDQQDYAHAFPLSQALAAEDEPFVFAVEQLGWMYEKGLGTKADYAKARHYYEQALALSKENEEYSASRANLGLGNIYHYGLGVAPDFAKAKAYYAAVEYLFEGEYQSALISLSEKDNKSALAKLAQLSDSEQYVQSDLKLGELYEQGEVVAKDLAKARHYYQRVLDFAERAETLQPQEFDKNVVEQAKIALTRLAN